MVLVDGLSLADDAAIPASEPVMTFVPGDNPNLLQRQTRYLALLEKVAPQLHFAGSFV